MPEPWPLGKAGLSQGLGIQKHLLVLKARGFSMYIQRFLREQGWKHKGAIPMLEADLWELGESLWQMRDELELSWEAKAACLPLGLKQALCLKGYVALEELLYIYFTIRDKLGWEARLELERLLMGVHDAYVTSRNHQPSGQEVLFPGQSENPATGSCRQCGSCCMGPASGPLSSSPADLALWEKLGREDLLYHTLKGVWKPWEKPQPEWAACPFLRFSKQGAGVCLVHPIKPLVCREFFCV